MDGLEADRHNQEVKLRKLEDDGCQITCDAPTVDETTGQVKVKVKTCYCRSRRALVAV